MFAPWALKVKYSPNKVNLFEAINQIWGLYPFALLLLSCPSRPSSELTCNEKRTKITPLEHGVVIRQRAIYDLLPQPWGGMLIKAQKSWARRELFSAVS